MNGMTIILWATILIVGVIACIGVKLHYKGAELGTKEKSLISKESSSGLFSSGRKILSNTNKDSKPTLNNNNTQNYSDDAYETYPVQEAENDSPQNIEYESPNQVLISYENEVKKTQEPMTQNQIDIMTSNNDQNNEKHELKDLFTIDELIKESKRKDSEREKESQRINNEPEDTTEIKESIIQKKEAEDKLIEEIMADEEIGELLNSEESDSETIQDIVDSAEESKEETIQDIIDSTEETAPETKAETIQDIIDSTEETAPETKAETIQDIIDSTEETAPEAAEETVQEVLDVQEPKDETIQDILDSTEEESTEATESEAEVAEPTTQKEIEEAITTASQEIEEEKDEEIGFSESEGITDALLNSEDEDEIKQPTLKSPTKIEESTSDEFGEPIDDNNLFTPQQEENDLDYRKDLAKITNTIKGSRLFQDVKEKLRPEHRSEPQPIEDMEESYIRSVPDYEDEYAPIINETHDEFGEVFEPEYNEDAIREENTRRLLNNTKKAPEPEVAKPKIETIKPKPSRESIKIKMGNADLVLKKGDEIIFKHDGETYSSQVYAINGDDISVKYRRKNITIKPEDVKKIY